MNSKIGKVPISAPTTATVLSSSISDVWSSAEQAALEKGLTLYKVVVDKNERWTKIAGRVSIFSFLFHYILITNLYEIRE